MITKAIKFNTGRNYSAEGQEILAWKIAGTEDRHGSFTVRFYDRTRGVYGQMDFMFNLDQRSVMHAYDGGLYDNVVIEVTEINIAEGMAK